MVDLRGACAALEAGVAAASEETAAWRARAAAAWRHAQRVKPHAHARYLYFSDMKHTKLSNPKLSKACIMGHGY